MLEGFKILQEQVGNFHIHENLVLINEEGIVKVWLNSNLACMWVEKKEIYNMNTISRKTMYPSQNSMVW
jgi:hypothetical protein